MPYIKLLAKIGIKANWISYFAVLLMFLHLYLIDKMLETALWLLLFIRVQDMIDGPLARYTKTASKQGEKVDVVCDQIIFSMAVIGSMIIEVIQPFLGISLIFLVLISKIVRGVFYKSIKNLNKKFKDMFVPIWISFITYFIPVWYALFHTNYGNELSFAFVIILLLDISYFSTKIALKRYKS